MAANKDIYKYYYFDGVGRGELIRFILHQAGVEFEDIRIPFENWRKIKAEMPAGQVPVLEIESNNEKKVFFQSGAIARYLARKFDLAGKTNEEAYKADETFECIREWIDASEKAFFLSANKEQQIKAIEEIQTVHTPRLFNHLEKHCRDRKSSFLVGDSLTFGDLVVGVLFDGMQTLADNQLFDVEWAKQAFPSMFCLAQTVYELPAIKAYREKRPQDKLMAFRVAMTKKQLGA